MSSDSAFQSFRMLKLYRIITIMDSISGLHRAEVMQQPSLCPWLWGASPDLSLKYLTDSLAQAYSLSILETMFWRLSTIRLN